MLHRGDCSAIKLSKVYEYQYRAEKCSVQIRYGCYGSYTTIVTLLKRLYTICAYTRHTTFSLSLGLKFCTSRKGKTGWGERVSTLGPGNVAASGLAVESPWSHLVGHFSPSLHEWA